MIQSPEASPLRIQTTKKVYFLNKKDRVAIVAYAGSAGLVLPSTPASKKERILGALDNFQARGSTAGGAGIKLAYEIAKENLIAGGNNRVILATLTVQSFQRSFL
jgi:Ca-activated chloride channel family protein